MAIQTIEFRVKGMQCPGCETVIEEAVGPLEGVEKVAADYARETVEVRFDPAKTKMPEIFRAIEAKGYQCVLGKRPPSVRQVIGKWLLLLFALAGAWAILRWGPQLAERLHLPELSREMGYGLLFLFGFLTGFHCIGMCGGFVLAYAARDAAQGKHSYVFSHLSYALGKTLSYTVIGGFFGLLGSAVAFTPFLRGLAAIVVGLFLVLFGLNMLRLLPHFRWLGFRMPSLLTRLLREEIKRHSTPFALGLLNGLMIACGPLQAMYLLAAGTGSPLEGAKLLLVFGAGTLPVPLVFWMLASLMSKQATTWILQASGMVVIAFGLVMMNRGLAVTGSGFDAKSLGAIVSTHVRSLAEKVLHERGAAYQVIRMEVTKEGYRPDTFVLKKGVPVRWIIVGKELTDCNKVIIVPELGLQFELKQGEQVIEFTPPKDGIIAWSCWMGMIRGTFLVQSEPGR
jgi:sulfite exporter TauE/SafE/copper chaperone CopZ